MIILNVKTCLSQVFETRVRLAKLIDQRSADAPPSDLDEKIHVVWAEYVEQYIQARKLIELFQDLRIRYIFISRYLLFVKPEYIAEDMRLEQCRVRQLHVQGIRQLVKAVNDGLVTKGHENP